MVGVSDIELDISDLGRLVPGYKREVAMIGVYEAVHILVSIVLLKLYLIMVLGECLVYAKSCEHPAVLECSFTYRSPAFVGICIGVIYNLGEIELIGKEIETISTGRQAYAVIAVENKACAAPACADSRNGAERFVGGSPVIISDSYNGESLASGKSYGAVGISTLKLHRESVGSIHERNVYGYRSCSAA